MEEIEIKRSIAIGSNDWISVTAKGEGQNVEEARLKATKKVLECLQAELVRILNIRPQVPDSSVFTQAGMELEGVNLELQKYL